MQNRMLLEMPQFRDSIPSFTNTFKKLSIRTLELKFDEMVSSVVSSNYGFFISKDLKQAIVVKYEKSEFEVRGSIIVELDFKPSLAIVWDGIEPEFNRPMIQVDGVANHSPTDADIGIVSELYSLIADNFILVSDNVQYQGGKALWIKIAKTCHLINKKVIVCDDGGIVADENQKPIVFNGSNLSESSIWSSENVSQNKFYCILMLVNDKVNLTKESESH